MARRARKDYLVERNLTRAPKHNVAKIGKRQVLRSVSEQQKKRLKARDDRIDFRAKNHGIK